MNNLSVPLLVTSIILFSPVCDVFAESRLFQNIEIKRIFTTERLQQLSSLYQQEGLTISEISWSHDGSFVLFQTGGTPPNHRMWKLRPDGNVNNLTRINFPFDDQMVAHVFGPYKLSPDDTEILFPSETQDPRPTSDFYTSNLHKFNLNDEKVTKISNHTGETNVVAFGWMPDGKKVVYETLRTYYEDIKHLPATEVITLWLADSGTGNIEKMLWNGTGDGFYSLDVSPDGNRLAPTGRSGLPIFDIDKAELQVLVESVERTDSYGFTDIDIDSPKWSDNGRFIVYWNTESHWDRPAPTEVEPDRAITTLKVVSVDGRINEDLFVSPGLVNAHELYPVGISPDGKVIAAGIPYAPWNHENDDIKNGSLYLIDLSTQAIPEFGVSTVGFFAAITAGTLVMTRFRRNMNSN